MKASSRLAAGLAAGFALCQLAGGIALAPALQGGSLADSAETPWVAQIAVLDVPSQAFVNCSATLVAPSWLLTARHCVENPNLSQAYASVGPGATYNYPFNLTTVRTHPTWDAALVKLDHPAKATPAVLATRIPSTGQTATAIGFGGSNTAGQARLEVVGSSLDGHLYARPSGGARSVIGDSGGPLVVNGEVVGVLSAAVQRPYEDFLSEDFKYVPSAQLRSWVVQTAGLASAPQPTNPNLNPNPQPQPSTPQRNAPSRISGTNRVQTALAAWQIGGFSNHSVVIATGRLAPDALAAGPLATALDAPLLLSVTRYIETDIVARILAWGIRDVRLIGSNLQFHPQDLARFAAAGVQVRRHAGANRYATAVEVAKETRYQWNLQGMLQNPVFLADGVNFPDALAAGAAAGRLQGVVLLTQGATLPLETHNYLSTISASRQVFAFVVGGPAVQAWSVTPVGNVAVMPVQGSNRYETAGLLADMLQGQSQSAIVASGLNFPDGLAAAPLCAKNRAVLLLTQAAQLPPETRLRLDRLPAGNRSFIMGGTGAVSDTVAWQIRG